MNKKYFKYIIFSLMFMIVGFTNVKAVDKLNLITESKTSKVCNYSYDYNGQVVSFNVYEKENNSIDVKKTISGTHISSSEKGHGGGGGHGGANEKIEDYEIGEYFMFINTSDANSFYSGNTFSCPSLNLYSRDNETTFKRDVMVTLNKQDYDLWYYNSQLFPNVTTYTSTCVFKTLHESKEIKYEVRYNMDKKKIISTRISPQGKVTSNAKKIETQEIKGLKCENIAIDICQTNISGKIYYYVRSENENSKCEKLITSSSLSHVEVVEDKKTPIKPDLSGFSKICTEDKNVRKVVRFIGYILVIIKILIPILIIIFGIKEFASAIISGNSDSLLKASKSFGFKIITAIIIFVLPTIIYFVIGIVDGSTEGTSDYNDCNNCLYSPDDCEI